MRRPRARSRPTIPAAFALDEWPPPAAINDDTANDREQFGYAAAASVMARIVDSAGQDGMQRVFAAADGKTTAYTGDAPPEPTTLPDNDWRRFLDLTEQTGGATGVADLLRTWALTPDEAALLPAREAARSDYTALVAAGDEWAAPLGVRMAMDGWQFAEAEGGIAAATVILDDRTSIDTLAADAGLDAPTGLESEYEAAATTDDLRAVAADAAETAASLKTVTAATEALSAPRDWLTELGLQGKTPDADLAAARAAWEAGDAAGATTLATTAAATVAVAGDAGRSRAMLAGSLVGLILVLVVVIALGRRRAGRRRAARAAAFAAAGPVDTTELWSAAGARSRSPRQWQCPAIHGRPTTTRRRSWISSHRTQTRPTTRPNPSSVHRTDRSPGRRPL